MYGEQTRIKGRHEDGYRQMVWRDEQDEGANEMAATRIRQDIQQPSSKSLTPTKRWMTRLRNGPTGCIINKVRISILFIRTNIAKWHDMQTNSVAIPHRPHTFFPETKLRRPSKDGITLVVAGDYTNTENQHITGLDTRADFEFDIHGSVHHNTILIKMTNKMQLCRIIYYFIVPWLLYMFQLYYRSSSGVS
jgi:hypothetical protein